MTRQDEALVREHLNRLRQLAATHEDYAVDPSNASPAQARDAAKKVRRLVELIETACFGVKAAAPEADEDIEIPGFLRRLATS